MILAIPEEKNKAIYALKKMINKRKATVKELQSLCGYLNFLNKAILPGRAFTRHMYSKYAVHWDDKPGKKKQLKPYHHI